MNWWDISEVWEVHCHHVNFEKLKLKWVNQCIWYNRVFFLATGKQVGYVILTYQICKSLSLGKYSGYHLKSPPWKMLIKKKRSNLMFYKSSCKGVNKLTKCWKLRNSFTWSQNYNHMLFHCSLDRKQWLRWMEQSSSKITFKVLLKSKLWFHFAIQKCQCL